MLDRLSFKTATLQKHKHILAHQGTLTKADAQTHVHQFMRASGLACVRTRPGLKVLWQIFAYELETDISKIFTYSGI